MISTIAFMFVFAAGFLSGIVVATGKALKIVQREYALRETRKSLFEWANDPCGIGPFDPEYPRNKKRPKMETATGQHFFSHHTGKFLLLYVDSEGYNRFWNNDDLDWSRNRRAASQIDREDLERVGNIACKYAGSYSVIIEKIGGEH